MTTNNIKYRNPIIIEAVFELRFPEQPWEIESFIKFSEKAKEKGFTIVKDSAKSFQITFGENQSPILNKGANHIQTWNEDETRLWQAGERLFAANQREPYDGWEKFKSHILDGFSIYKQIVKSTEVDILSMRYLNRIELDKDQAPTEMLKFLPSDIEFSDNLVGYACKAEYRFEEGEKIIIASAKEISEANKNSVILDISYLKPNPVLEVENIEGYIEKIHDRIFEYFQNSITDELKNKMEEI